MACCNRQAVNQQNTTAAFEARQRADIEKIGLRECAWPSCEISVGPDFRIRDSSQCSHLFRTASLWHKLASIWPYIAICTAYGIYGICINCTDLHIKKLSQIIQKPSKQGIVYQQFSAMVRLVSATMAGATRTAANTFLVGFPTVLVKK